MTSRSMDGVFILLLQKSAESQARLSFLEKYAQLLLVSPMLCRKEEFYRSFVEEDLFQQNPSEFSLAKFLRPRKRACSLG